VKKISLYLWLSYKLPELFPDKEKAERTRVEINNFCENSLKSNKTLKPMVRRNRNKPQNRANQNPRNKETSTKNDDRNGNRQVRRNRRRDRD